MAKFKKIKIAFITLLILILLTSCHSGEYNDIVRIEHQPVQVMVVANYCIKGEIRPVKVGIYTVQRYFPDEYTTIVHYDYGNGYSYLELEIHDKALYEAVQIGDYIECILVTEIFEVGQCSYLRYIHKE